jgi:hypothetical protein
MTFLADVSSGNVDNLAASFALVCCLGIYLLWRFIEDLSKGF